MKFISKLFRHHTTALTTLLLFFLFFHAGMIPCCPCGSADSHISSCDIGHHHSEHITGNQARNMDVTCLTLLSSSSHKRVCGCEKIMVSNYLIEENANSYRSIKPDKYHFSIAYTGDTTPNAFGKPSSNQHLPPPQNGSNTIQSIRTVVILI